jgi:CRISPR-associated protein Cas2
MNDHLYIVAYDIADRKRWRRVFRVMKGYGEWMQLSVFQCRLDRLRHAELIALLDGILQHREDRLISIDMGPADGIAPRVTALGNMEFRPIERAPIIV